MSDRADVIFIGQVVGVHPHDDAGAASGYVEIDFRVDQAIRGCTAGTYVMREWAGLWAGDARRYQPGQRLLMMLHAPGPSGMSSPVGGMDGAIPIRGLASASPLATAASNPTAPVADLRWLGAKILRSQSYTLALGSVSNAPDRLAAARSAGLARPGERADRGPDRSRRRHIDLAPRFPRSRLQSRP